MNCGRRGVLTVSQTLLVAEAYLAGVVDLATQRGVAVKLVLGADAKAGVFAARRPRQVDARLQLRRQLLVDGAAKLLAVVTEIATR